jgi:hypothetical protein
MAEAPLMAVHDPPLGVDSGDGFEPVVRLELWDDADAGEDGEALGIRRPSRPRRARSLRPRLRGNGPAERPQSAAARRERRRHVPAALEWRDVSLPLVGRVHAALWLPTILLAACAVALVYLAETSGIATTGYDIQRLQAQRSEWQLRNQQLSLELAKLHSLAWIDAEATTRLGMQRPSQVAHVSPGR